MQTVNTHINDGVLAANGNVSEMPIDELNAIVERYPYFHLARLTLLRKLYEMRDPAFNDELRRSAIYLPSRETIYEFVEGDKMRPRPQEDSPALYGATQARKVNERLAGSNESRTESLIDSFLNSVPGLVPQAEKAPAPLRRGRADATQDYIAYLMAEEEELQAEARLQAEQQAAVGQQAEAEQQTVVGLQAEQQAVIGQQAEAEQQPTAEQQTELIDNFIQKQGDRRIRLKDKKDSELVKPVINPDDSDSQGAFTETLARIYIKQGKFEHAIEIIRRLSLKYPKKNRYFADQIRFLEKLIANQNALKR